MPGKTEPHASWSMGIDVPRGPLEEALFDRILRRLGKRPLAWILPASEDLKASALLARIAQRRDSCGDIIVPKGYAGCLHPLLTQDELEKEVGWGLRNPWGTGVADLFGAAPDLLVPRLPDLARPSSLAVYREAGFRSLGVPVGTDAPSEDAGMRFLPCLRIPDAAGRVAGGLKPRGPQPLFLLDISRIGSLQALDAVLDAYSRASLLGGPFAPLLRLLPETACAGGWDGIAPGEWRRILSAAGELRRKRRRRNEEYQKALALLAGYGRTGGATADGEAGLAPRERTLLAAMQGEVVLEGGDFDATLIGGRFSGVGGPGRAALPRFPAESSLTVRGVRHPFRTVSAFSFEAEGCTGLREELRLDGFRNSSMKADYFFLDGYPYLLVDIEVSWPDLGRGVCADACVPFGLRLFPMEHADEAVVLGSGPDGDPLRVPVGPRGCAAAAVAGTCLHVVRGGEGVTITFPAPAGPSMGLVLFRVVKDGNGTWLDANPFGSWSPFLPDWRAGRPQRFSLALGIGGTTAPRRLPALPKDVKDRLAMEAARNSAPEAARPDDTEGTR